VLQCVLKIRNANDVQSRYQCVFIYNTQCVLQCILQCVLQCVIRCVCVALRVALCVQF